MMAQSVLVTGATGFIGCGLCPVLKASGFHVVTAGRSACDTADEHRNLPDFTTPELTIAPDVLTDIDHVVHLAAIAHRDGVGEADYDAVNRAAPFALAQAAAQAQCQRFVFLSTAKVLGDTGRNLTDDTAPEPPDAYSRAKLAADDALAAIAQKSSMAIISLRPPLVHGADAKANFKRLAQLIERGGIKGLPVPLGKTGNQRSLISRDHLITAIIASLTAPNAQSGAYLVADQPAIPTDALIRHLAAGMGRKPPVFAFPPAVLRLILRLLGKAGLAERLLGDFSVDDTRFRQQFGWAPAGDAAEALEKTGQAITGKTG